MGMTGDSWSQFATLMPPPKRVDWHGVCINHSRHNAGWVRCGIDPGGRYQPPRLPAKNEFRIGSDIMLSWALMFLIFALIAGVLGFSGVAGTAAWIAQILFVAFLILFLISLVTGGGRRTSV
jgi:uncharacterized membrane protein YtjA (UPF0391 family)